MGELRIHSKDAFDQKKGDIDLLFAKTLPLVETSKYWESGVVEMNRIQIIFETKRKSVIEVPHFASSLNNLLKKTR